MTKPVEIYVLDRQVRLLQPASGFRTSLDSVMLAAACPAGEGDRVLDMGCGVGGAAFCLLHRVPRCSVTGVDIQKDYIALAQENVALNNGADRIAFVCADIAMFAAEERFDHVICNPPYLEAGNHTLPPDQGKAIAVGEGDIQVWIDAGFKNLKSGGSLTVIHRADMSDKIILALGRRFGAVEIIPLWPRAGEDAKRVIIRAVKDRRSPAKLHAGIVLHRPDGHGYTEQAERLLRGGEFLV